MHTHKQMQSAETLVINILDDSIDRATIKQEWVSYLIENELISTNLL